MTHTWTNSQVLSADGETPIRQVTINGSPYWQASGRTFPQVAGAEDPPADDHTDDDSADDDEFDKDRALATIRKQRDREKAQAAELKAIKAEAASLKAREQARADAERTELEKAQARLAERERAHAEVEQKLRRVQINQAIERAARKHNARNPEVVARLINHDELELGDDGEPKNAEELVKALLKAETYLVAQQAGTNGVPATPRGSGPVGYEDRVKENIEKLRASGDYQPL